MNRVTAALLIAIAGGNLGYFAFPAALQPRAFYIGSAGMAMVLFGLLTSYGPRSALWAASCLWGYFEAWQCAVCRIATFDLPRSGDSMICVGLLGIRPYQILLSGTLALLALGWVKARPKP